MITEILPYLFGTIAFLGGLYGFLYSFEIYTPKLSTELQKEKHELWIKKFGKMMKILSIVIMFYGLYLLIFGDSKTFLINGQDVSHNEWKKADSIGYVEGCLRSAQSMSLQYPEITKNYCNCTFEKVKENFSYLEYIELSKLSSVEQTNILNPIIESCSKDAQEEIKVFNNSAKDFFDK